MAGTRQKYDCIQNGGLIKVDLYTLVQSDKANLKQIQVDWLLMRHDMTWNQRTLALNMILFHQTFQEGVTNN